MMALVEIQLAVDVLLSIIGWPRLLKQLQLPPSLPKQGQTEHRNTRISHPDQNLYPHPLKLKCNARIAEPQILHFGDETKTANPSVTHAVLPSLCIILTSGLYHKLHGEHRPIQMKKMVIKRRKRIVPTNYPSNIQHPASTSSNSPSPPPNHSPRLAVNPYGPLPPLWASQQTNTRTSYSPEPTDFTNYRPYSCATFPSSYNEQNTLPPLRLPVGNHPQPISPIQHVGNAIPLPKRKLNSPDMDVKRARLEDVDPLEGARVLLTLGSRESVIRKKAELLGEIEILKEKLEKLQKAVGECDEFLGKA